MIIHLQLKLILKLLLALIVLLVKTELQVLPIVLIALLDKERLVELFVLLVPQPLLMVLEVRLALLVLPVSPVRPLMAMLLLVLLECGLPQLVPLVRPLPELLLLVADPILLRKLLIALLLRQLWDMQR